MIFMSQSGLTDISRAADWDRWYIEHLRIMRTVPGISSAERFLTTHQSHPPSLAMYSVASEAVFRDSYYLSVRGFGEWKPLIDPRWYRRNLFDGLAQAPAVPPGHLLLVADRSAPDSALEGFTWLEAVALDRSTPWRGTAVIAGNKRSKWETRDVAFYMPVASAS